MKSGLKLDRHLRMHKHALVYKLNAGIQIRALARTPLNSPTCFLPRESAKCITNLRVLTVGGFIKRRAQRIAIFTDITQPYLEVLDLFAVHIQDRPDHNATNLFSENYLQRIKQIAMDMPLFVDDEKAKPFINEAPAG
ncbi:MAG: hypothetical protein BYD32DRAFT_436342 [Podila humilis]|nr:MAG: hypothetical protein BYD32DRAFT_436342 [Podila humilis]